MELKQLPIGAKVRESQSGMVFLTAAHDHPGYDGTILVADRIVRKGAFDAKEPLSADPKVKKYGNNDYETSNVHQWLNSQEEDWYHPLHAADTPPNTENCSTPENAYDHEAGFLHRFSLEFLSALVKNDIPCVKYDGERCVAGTVQGRVFLLSADELGLTRFTNVPEGSLIPLFRDFRMRLGVKEAVKEDFDFPGEISPTNMEMGWYYWLRTPHHRYPFLTAHIHFSGYISYLHAYNSNLGIRPALTISGDIPVENCTSSSAEPMYELFKGAQA